MTSEQVESIMEGVQNTINEVSSINTTVELTEEEESLLNSVLENVYRDNNIDTIKQKDNSIPQNSPSALLSSSTSRFSDAIWYEEVSKQEIVLAGLGGIGSYVAFLLGRVHPKHIYLYDPDIIEENNMSGQLYSSSDIDNKKVTTVLKLLASYSRYYSVTTFGEEYDSTGITRKIMICGFDNMKARKTFFNMWLHEVNRSADEKKDKYLFIDGRLAAEHFQIFAIQGNDTRAIKDYQENWLFSDNEAEKTICSYKQTSFCAMMIASYMVNWFINFIANQCNPLYPREVPYFTEYNATTGYLKIKA